MKSKILQGLTIFLIIEIGLIHFFNAQHEYEEAAFLGYLFVANFLGALVAAYGVYRKQLWGWGLGLGIAAGSIAGYVWSRSLGLPGLETEVWLDPWGLVALAAEGLFIFFFILRPWRMAEVREGLSPTPAWLRYALPVAGALTLVLINGLTYQWETITGGLDHDHIISRDEIIRMPLTSTAGLEREYGLRVEQVAISALDSIVDVRIKVIDPEKAYPLLEDHAAILVDGQSVIPAPHMHTHARLKPGGIYFLFFPTQNRTVQTGSEVSLFLGDVRMEPVIAQ